MVLRDGNRYEIESKNLVPGDFVKVMIGDKVPADIRIAKINTTTLKVDQSMLTGESDPVYKFTDRLNCNENSRPQDKNNILFSSTTIIHGEAEGIVVLTGMNREVGNIQQQINEAKDEEEKSPLKQKLDQFG